MAQPPTTPKIEELRFRLKTDPKSRLFFPLAEELRKVGQLGDAEQVLRTGLTQHPTYLSAWVSLGRVLRDEKNDGGAVDALNKALQLDPGNVVAARLLADAYLALGEKVEAIKKYKLVQALMPGDEEIGEIIGRLDAELNRPTQAAAPPAATAEEEETPFAEPAASLIAPEAVTADTGLNASVEERLDNAVPFPTTEGADEETPFASAASIAEGEAGVANEPLAFTDTSGADAAGSDSVFGSPEEPARIDTHPFGVAGSPWDDTGSRSPVAPEEVAIGEERTGDDEPMLASHDESPFEEPAAAGYTAAAFGVEAPEGMHVERAPLAAELPLDLAEEQPLSDASPGASRVADEDVFAAPVSGEAEVFSDAASEPGAEAEPLGSAAPAEPDEDITSTLTMADLYARQGLTAEARHIYETILQRDPSNDAVRSKLDALQQPPAAGSAAPDVQSTAERQAKIQRLQGWLNQVGRREAGGV